MSQYSLVKESDTHYAVIKDGFSTYNIVFKKSAWSCSCPARGKCKHLDMLPSEAKVKRYSHIEIEEAYSKIENILWPYKHTICGSYRRCAPDCKDIDIVILCDAHSFEQVCLQLQHSGFFKYIAGGEKKIHGTINGIPVDIDRVEDPNHYAAHTLYRTGPVALNIRMRKRAQECGFVLNEYTNAASEAEIFERLGMSYIPLLMRQQQCSY